MLLLPRIQVSWTFCIVIVLLVMMLGFIWVVQDEIWLAPPYLYESTKIDLGILFAWVVTLPLLILMRPKGSAHRFVIVFICCIALSPCYFGFVFYSLLVNRSIPDQVYCKELEVSAGKANFVCTVPQLDTGFVTYAFEQSSGSPLMRLIDVNYTDVRATSQPNLQQ